MYAIPAALLGYFVGTFNPAYFFGKLKGFDVRTRGSGNAGATNAMLTMGKVMGVLCALLDILKAFAAYKLAKLLLPQMQFAGILAGAACILGHIFPVWMGFKGGKGLACLGGMILAYNWKLFCVLLAVEVVLTLIVNYICFMPMSASVAFTLIYALTAADLVGTIALLVVTVVIQCKHIENVKRIREGTEFHVSYLWNKEAEIQRLVDKMGDDRLDEIV